MENLIGQKFHRLTVIAYGGEGLPWKHRWWCECACGNVTLVQSYNLKNSAVQSCGCLRVDFSKNNTKTHGMTHTAEHRSWALMLSRCRNKKLLCWKDYGARGIKVCKKWNSFEAFYKDMGDKPSAKHSIDRVDNNKGYCKSNCRWATKIEQARNTRTCRYFTWNGMTKCLSAWAEHFKVSNNTIWGRLKRGWKFEDIVKDLIKI